MELAKQVLNLERAGRMVTPTEIALAKEVQRLHEQIAELREEMRDAYDDGYSDGHSEGYDRGFDTAAEYDY